MTTRADSPAQDPVDPLDTTRARDAIFARIRNAQHRPEQPTQGERDAVADYIARHPAGPRPLMPADLAAHFAEQALKMASTLESVATLADVPAAAARYLSSLNLAPRAVAWTTLQSLDWSAAGLNVEFRPPVREPQADHDHGDLVGITGCFCAIAETGSLMLLSGPESVASAALLPETHIAVVPQSRIVAHLRLHGGATATELAQALGTHTGATSYHVRVLAGAGALNALAGHRREALWQVAAVHEDDELFRHAGTEDAAPAPLAPMTPLERVQQDFLLTGLTTGQHPLALLRDRLPGVQRAADLPALPPRTRVCIGGSVITRQRPGTAKGVCFITLEDETGFIDVIIHQETYEKYRATLRGQTFLLLEQGNILGAFLNVLLSVLLCVAGIWAGFVAMRAF